MFVLGFAWTYDISNPDLTAPNGKIYWVLTDGDNTSMSVEDIVAGNNPTQPTCLGSAEQDDQFHVMEMECTLTPGV